MRAFEHSRPVIAIDGMFLTGQYKGTLLAVLTKLGLLSNLSLLHTKRELYDILPVMPVPILDLPLPSPIQPAS